MPSPPEENEPPTRAYGTCDAGSEPVFRRLVAVAAGHFTAPIAGLWLIDAGRECCRSWLGLDLGEIAPSSVFGSQAFAGPEPVVVPDTAADPRFEDEPLVAGDPAVRFYAATPLVMSDGRVLGSLYVMDTEARQRPSPAELKTLTELAAAVTEVLVLQVQSRRASEKSALGLHLAAIVDSSDDAISSTNLDGTITSWNVGAQALYGYTAEEMVGQHFSMLLPDDRPQEAGHILRRIREGQPVRHLETVRVGKNGTAVPVSLTISPIKDDDGKVVGASSIARNMSERRAAGKLKAAHDRAMAANRLKSQFLATMSHEIRTPMNGVIGMTGLLLDSDLDPEQRDYAETVRSSAEALLTIINDILDFSKIEAGKLDLEVIDFSLGAVVEDVADLLAEKAHLKGIELSTLIHPQVPTDVRGDPGRLRQILTNLLSNAVKFTGAGEIVVKACLAEDGPDDVVIRMEVSDTGIGLTEEAQERLFLPFSQADSSTTRLHGGTGLGLAISKQLVELMGGKIWCESEPGAGTTFRFTVPLARQAPGAQPQLRPRRDMSGLRVLIVDDNLTNRRILEHQVRSWAMPSATAPGATKALEMMREAVRLGHPYDVALVDMEMPVMDGFSLAHAVLADSELSSTRLVLLTSRGVRGTAASAREVGFSAYLSKPVRQSQLYDCLTTVVEGDPGPTDRLVTRHTISEDRARSRPRLLVADDNVVNQSVAVAMLAKLGYRADAVANGAEAVEARSRISYGAILMDCQMPEMDGYEATAEIRRREAGSSRVPIIAMTASAMKGDRQRCLDSGMDDYVTKPVKLDILEAALGRWVRAEATSAGDTG
ncbi:MAG TPA: response regulator [Acidimicrobiales bacterium]|nr:response regulator [Acidimicrobiales bacterium]